MNWFCLKACTKCGGDLAVDDGDWICLQCGTYYYTGLYPDLHHRRWLSTPSQPTLGAGDARREGDAGRPQVFDRLKGHRQERAHLLGAG